MPIVLAFSPLAFIRQSSIVSRPSQTPSEVCRDHEMPFTMLSSRLTPAVLLLLRVIVGFLFIQHGLAKLIDFPHMSNIPDTFAIFGRMSTVFQLSAGIIETFSGMLLVIGWFTRSPAFLLCGFSAVAYFTIHAPKSFFPALNGGEHSVLFCFASLLLVTTGPGLWAIDDVDALVSASRTSP